MRNSRAHSMRASAIDVRELASIAIDRTSDIGLEVYNATDATGPREGMARSGTILYAPRRYSIDGMSPTSMLPSCSSEAHFDGTSNRRVKREERSSPKTSGRA